MHTNPCFTAFAQVMELPDASKEQLQDAWKAWMQEAGGCTVLGSMSPCQQAAINGACSSQAILVHVACLLAEEPVGCRCCCTTLRARLSLYCLGRACKLGRCIWLQANAWPAPPACVQWRRRDPSHLATRLARRCGSSASEQLSMGGSLEGTWCGCRLLQGCSWRGKGSCGCCERTCLTVAPNRRARHCLLRVLLKMPAAIVAGRALPSPRSDPAHAIALNHKLPLSFVPITLLFGQPAGRAPPSRRSG